VVLFEPNDWIGTIISSVNNLTGSTFITLLLLTTIATFLFMALNAAFGFGTPLEFSIIIVLPMHIAVLAYVTNWMSVAGSFLIYVGIMIAKNILKR